uniref:Uncharacterized protein n=1 Tax=Rhizophora mucronata TaxID=61149 RepID=A0A2P2LDS0_RHIMU
MKIGGVQIVRPIVRRANPDVLRHLQLHQLARLSCCGLQSLRVLSLGGDGAWVTASHGF